MLYSQTTVIRTYQVSLGYVIDLRCSLVFVFFPCFFTGFPCRVKALVSYRAVVTAVARLYESISFYFVLCDGVVLRRNGFLAESQHFPSNVLAMPEVNKGKHQAAASEKVLQLH